MKIIHGDCLIELEKLPENSVDSVVTDPPYGLSFMGRAWDHGVPGIPFWQAIMRVMKPGAHLVAMGGTRTVHRLTCAIEDAGFEIRDRLLWIYGSGFPKSQNIGRAIDLQKAKEAGIELGPDDNVPSTPEGDQWRGFGSALKPSYEPIVLARKPLSESTIAANVLRWGAGAINIGACRVATEKGTGWNGKTAAGNTWNKTNSGLRKVGEARPVTGRWPANLLTDGSDEVVGMFPESKDGVAGKRKNCDSGVMKVGFRATDKGWVGYGGSGSAARFFYSAKASKADRAGSKHITVKPVSLMQYLARLITPPSGTVLDPFAGSGTTGEACKREGFDCILIEKEAEYISDIKRRLGSEENKCCSHMVSTIQNDAY